ncbi:MULTISPECIES: DNA-deoxyinosine glycosylase [Ralstonia solanacearum species complex]|uniref:DNA-deoxyinosine glycosylase n=1 Tax=Ralstonia nicotianae TaxID=3037696 RepID=A0ABX7ZWP3_9RALS|nr:MULTISPECIES: DNA-deoxyinosine glycosylase [Ralstonia solanacearum species complex]AZU56569.1 DNA-deoxyinosine glycosylase [Ralstonia solanacearum]MCD9228543.1 DNA-deoxyinosine glycosylase [Ralstonia pseudosolanacearum]MCK4123686.1 DNA-deoxyinosine glycosylase [Ralstonia pseudosolanacearum]MCK4137619.1 DNA-deoxyinosine glycosylase [Ralstonia pseudosolanacearum]MCK4154575.1 DNA-deoxyinosine glycosylase [Ralstonia pseudosolanacearum]
MAEALPDLQRGLAPILDAEVRVLVLGSFPGEASLAAQQYYAHPRNQFWPLMGALLDLPLPAMPYAARVRALLARHIGVWDVLGACVREGSLDAAIRHPQANDFDLLHRRAPRLRRVGFNGGTAGRFAKDFARAGFETVVLPSSSPAHAARSFEQKLALWRSLLPDG